MYLLHTQDSDPSSNDPPTITLEYHVGAVPPYAILSHRWGPPAEEVTFADFASPAALQRARRRRGFAKLEHCCLTALEYGLPYVWIDTCCIDQSSSAELSEAINSMFAWYRAARVCFAYLEDVPPPPPHTPTPLASPSSGSGSGLGSGLGAWSRLVVGDDALAAPGSAFRASVWFTRGWTLQELLAPEQVLFFAADWGARPLGTRASLAALVADITGIPQAVLVAAGHPHHDGEVRGGDALAAASLAQKMSWASGRRTTRVEDEAYALMGLLGVNMPTIYGEGRRAFGRLQEELIRRSTDHSIFAWDGGPAAGEVLGMLAPSPRAFANSGGYAPMEVNELHRRFPVVDDQGLSVRELASVIQPSFSMTNFGLDIRLPTTRMPIHFQQYHLAFLACTHGLDRQMVVIFLRRNRDRPDGHFYRTSFDGRTVFHVPYRQGMELRKIVYQALWISTPGPSHLAPPKPTHDYMTRVHFLGRGWQAAATERVANPALTSSDDTLDLTLAPGDYAVLNTRFNFKVERGGAPARYYHLTVLCALGLHNGRVWFHFHQPYETEYGAEFLESSAAARRQDMVRAEAMLPSYDVFTRGPYWDGLVGGLRFTDDPEAWPGRAEVVINELNSIKLNRWTAVDEHGRAVEEVRLSQKYTMGMGVTAENIHKVLGVK